MRTRADMEWGGHRTRTVHPVASRYTDVINNLRDMTVSVKAKCLSVNSISFSYKPQHLSHTYIFEKWLLVSIHSNIYHIRNSFDCMSTNSCSFLHKMQESPGSFKRNYYPIFKTNIPTKYARSIDNAAAIVTILRAGWTQFQTPSGVREKFLVLIVKTVCEVHPASYSISTEIPSRGQSRRSAKLNNQLHVVPSLAMSKAMRLGICLHGLDSDNFMTIGITCMEHHGILEKLLISQRIKKFSIS